MSGSSFRSVFMVASCATAALGCYLVSLRVASERAALEDIESEIVMAQRDIRLLQTEIGTRGRLAQLERWNVRVLALSAPAADQFLDGGFALARLARPTQPDVLEAPVVLAAAPADAPQSPITDTEEKGSAAGAKGVSPRDLMHVASLKTGLPPSSRMTIDLTEQGKAADKPMPVSAKPALPAARKIASADSSSKAVRAPTPAKPIVRKPAADPLAPLPAPLKSAKDNGKTQ